MSRAVAIEFVAELLERGYTIEQAEHESILGFDPCDGSNRSYSIRQGVIQVPAINGDKFRFRTLANEVPRQRDLFI